MDPMQVGGLTNIFQAFGDDPAARYLALAAGLRALWSLVAWKRCRLAAGEAHARSPLEPRRRIWRFSVLVILGIALALWGLFELSALGMKAPWALPALAMGMYLFMTEPVRLALFDAERRVEAAVGGPDHRLELVQLRGQHIRLIGMEIGVLLLLTLSMSVA